MVELVAKTPCAGLLPRRIGALVAEEAPLGPLTILKPYKGQTKALSEALKAARGMAVPGVGRATGKEGARAIWFGRDEILLAGLPPTETLTKHAAVVDQSDGWAAVTLSGPGHEDVLARLVPLDLRAASFKRGHTARTLIGHMNGSVTRLSADRMLLLVFRSMAATLVHELTEAMESVTARS